MVMYFEGTGLMCFLSTYVYRIVIHDILEVPRLSTSLFSSNEFAKEIRLTYQDVLEPPTRKYDNRYSGAVKFSTAIRSNILAYLDWRVEHVQSVVGGATCATQPYAPWVSTGMDLLTEYLSEILCSRLNWYVLIVS
jgi:hypothetical protein